MQIGHKAPCGLQFKTTSAEGVVEGYAATWDRDLGGDRYEKGAFKSVIDGEFPDGRIKIYREHRVAIGRPVDLYENDTGLFVKAQIVPGSSRDGDETLNLARDNVYDAFSVAYKVDPGRVRYVSEKGLRTRVIGRVASLPHVGILDDPMNTAAVIEAVKGQKELIDHEKKGLWSFAEAMQALAIVEDIRRWGDLNEEEAALAQQLLDDMAAASEAIKSHLPTEKDPTPDLSAFIAAAKGIKDQAQRTSLWTPS